ncbi:MAG TPA: HAD-IIIA family hydrolase [Edaphocola sp.]|nr:HAD-IIIA family hydrolase [Edaphocola sp.]
MNILALFQPIKVFVFDIDGVLTDGQLLLSEDGAMLRSMNIKDGFALQWAVKQGYEIVIISGGRSEAAKCRLEKLGIEKVFIDVPDKPALLNQLMAANNWTKETVLYMGDDIPDLDCLKAAGLATCPADAVPEILNICPYISPNNGGRGAVRDVLEKALKIQGHWPF